MCLTIETAISCQLAVVMSVSAVVNTEQTSVAACPTAAESVVDSVTDRATTSSANRISHHLPNSTEFQSKTHRTRNDRGAASQRELDLHRSLRYLSFILSCYLILIIPYICCGSYLMITGDYRCVSDELTAYFNWSPYFVSVTNPLVVILAQKEFRHAVKSLFKCGK